MRTFSRHSLLYSSPSDIEIPMAHASQSSRQLAIRIKKQYVDYVVNGINILNDKETAVPFSALPEVAIGGESEKESISNLLGKVQAAISNGDLSKLQLLLGPALYQYREQGSRGNRAIFQKRWEWLAAREAVDFHAQAFNLTIWFARKHVCDEYVAAIKHALRNAKNQIETARIRLNSPPHEPGLFLDGNVFICVEGRAEDQKAAISKEIEEYQRKVAILENLWNDYSSYPSLQVAYDRDGILAYAEELQKTYSQKRLQQMYESSENQEILILDYTKKQDLKSFLNSNLQNIAEIIRDHISVLGKQILSTVDRLELKEEYVERQEERKENINVPTDQASGFTPTAVESAINILLPVNISIIGEEMRKHAYKNPKILQSVATKIDSVFAETNNISEILFKLRNLWVESLKHSHAIENDYLELVNPSHRERHEALLVAEYKVQSNKYLCQLTYDEKNKANMQYQSVVDSKIGTLSLDVISLKKYGLGSSGNLLQSAIEA
jgi:hypothetical protein